VVTTIHGLSSPRILPAYRAYDDRVHNATIHNATIHNGIDLDAFAFRADPDGYVVSFGRIHSDKGTAEAIDIARAAGRPIQIAGIVHDHAYFDAEVGQPLGSRRTPVAMPSCTTVTGQLAGSVKANALAATA
jgi:glycosyltransferase involved in cell wall biosynthesis